MAAAVARDPVSEALGGGRRRVLHLSLRSRITLGFAFGALALATAIASITYFTARSQIVSQELTAVRVTAYDNAQIVYDQVTAESGVYGELQAALAAIVQIDRSSTSSSAGPTHSLYYSSLLGDQPITPTPQYGPSLIHASLRNAVIHGNQPAYEVFDQDGTPMVAVGVPISTLNADYFQIFSLEPTLRTLQIIAAALVGAGIVTTIAGAVLGRWAAGRALRPLREVSDAALAIASGRLGTRLETADAPDLAVLASSFNRMVDRLQQRIERDARFTSDVSHELRSPLTTLAASLSVIEARRDELPERSRQALDLVTAEIRRFQHMVGELLEISRLDAGSADFEESVVPIGELVHRAVEAAGSPEVPVEVEPGVATRQVVVDKRRFERIMTNLVENAARYGGGATRVAVEGRETSVRIAVEDAGPGIPPHERQRIFERFARGSVAAGSRGAGGGTGLGLALVLEHVKLHGGRVWVEDRRGSPGARFVVELPLARPDEEADDDELDGTNAPPRRRAPRQRRTETRPAPSEPRDADGEAPGLGVAG